MRSPRRTVSCPFRVCVGLWRRHCKQRARTNTATVRARNDRYYQRTERVAAPVSAFT